MLNMQAKQLNQRYFVYHVADCIIYNAIFWTSFDVVNYLAILAKKKTIFSQMRIALANFFYIHQDNNKRSCILHAFQRKFWGPNWQLLFCQIRIKKPNGDKLDIQVYNKGNHAALKWTKPGRRDRP